MILPLFWWDIGNHLQVLLFEKTSFLKYKREYFSYPSYALMHRYQWAMCPLQVIQILRELRSRHVLNHLHRWFFIIFGNMSMLSFVLPLVLFSSDWTIVRLVSHLITMIALYRWEILSLLLSFLLKISWMRFLIVKFVWWLRFSLRFPFEVGFLPSSFCMSS